MRDRLRLRCACDQASSAQHTRRGARRPGGGARVCRRRRGDPAVELHSLMLLRHGHVVHRGLVSTHTRERTRLLYSLSKSFTSTALAFALAEGLVELDGPVVSHFPEFDADIADARSRPITLRHVASMASGHDRDMAEEPSRVTHVSRCAASCSCRRTNSPAPSSRTTSPARKRGSVIERVAGVPLSEYLRPGCSIRSGSARSVG